jgi:hypothetical protein
MTSLRFTFAMLVSSCLASCISGGTSGGGGGSGADGGASGGSSGSASSGGAASSGGGGNAVTIGPDVNAQAGLVNTFRCSDGYPIQTNAVFPQPFYGAGAQSCLVLTFLAPDGPSLGSGTAVSASLRVGTSTGPMRFVRMRILYSRSTGPKCCSLEQYGDAFTPAANTLSTIPLGFAMRIDPLPPQDDLSTIIANDLIALEVLAPDVAIPGVWTNSGGAVLGTASYMWLPALSAQNVPAPSGQLLNYQGSYSGFVPTFNISYLPN